MIYNNVLRPQMKRNLWFLSNYNPLRLNEEDYRKLEEFGRVKDFQLIPKPTKMVGGMDAQLTGQKNHPWFCIES